MSSFRSILFPTRRLLFPRRVRIRDLGRYSGISSQSTGCRILLEGAAAAAICYGLYKGYSYVSAVIAKKREVILSRQQQHTEEIKAAVPAAPEGVGAVLLRLKSQSHREVEEKKTKEKVNSEVTEIRPEPEMWAKFMGEYKSDEERREGAQQLLVRLSMLLNTIKTGGEKANRSINATNPDFQNAVLKNKLADELFVSIGFVKKDAYYVRKAVRINLGI